ncbi:MAG: hypothetical protein AAF557_04985 [Pseudomonadota bacterium]
MPPVLKTLFLCACILPLAACGIWSSDDEDDVVLDTNLAAERNKVPVQSVGKVEIGRTRDGYLITVFGTAPGIGYAAPELRVRRGGQPAADGFLEFDFIAVRPADAATLPPGTTRARAIRADLPISARELSRAAGIRVLALRGGVQVPINLGG